MRVVGICPGTIDTIGDSHSGTLLLAQNFLQDAAGRYYLPDPANAEGLEKLRRKALL